MNKNEIINKVDIICERLMEYRAYNPSLANLSYSGGRDSHLLLHIIRNILGFNNSQFPAIYANTANEYIEIFRRIKEADVTILKSENNIFKVFENEGLPLFSKIFSKYWNDLYVRGWNPKITNDAILADFTKKSEWINSEGLLASDKCCKCLKEDILRRNKANIVGLRKAEKGRRAYGINAEYDFCVKNTKVLFKPIFDLTNSDLFEIERALNIHVPEIYNYLDRTGCVMCGFGTKKQIKNKIQYLFLKEPGCAKFYVEYFRKYLRYRKII